MLRSCWLEAGVVNGCFLVHIARPVIEALIRMAEQLGPGGGSCCGAVEAP